MPILEARDIHAGYGGLTVLRGISLEVEEGQRWAVLGRNGTGKSTFIKTIAALLRPEKGVILIDGKPVEQHKARERARRIAYVPQKPVGIVPYTVKDFIMLGRYSSMGLFGLPGYADTKAVSMAMELCQVRELSERMMETLSGGEFQRVLLAGALAQDAPLLLLDEPTTYLDPANERLFFKALESAHRHKALTILMVTHDINTALHASTHVLALLKGQVHYAGEMAPFREQCPEVLGTLYGIPFKQYSSDSGGTGAFGTWGDPG